MFMPNRLHLVICSCSEKQVVGCTLIVGVHINKSDRKRWSEAWEYILPSVCVWATDLDQHRHPPSTGRCMTAVGRHAARAETRLSPSRDGRSMWHPEPIISLLLCQAPAPTYIFLSFCLSISALTTFFSTPLSTHSFTSAPSHTCLPHLPPVVEPPFFLLCFMPSFRAP